MPEKKKPGGTKEQERRKGGGTRCHREGGKQKRGRQSRKKIGNFHSKKEGATERLILPYNQKKKVKQQRLGRGGGNL